MRLYKYLLISDGIINNPNIFKEEVFTKEYKHHKKNNGGEKYHEVEVKYKNKFYTYVNDKKITFMSFEYLNYASYSTAYTIIDTEDIEKIRLSIVKHRTPWSVNHDTENKVFNKKASLKQIELFKKAGVLTDNDIPPGKVFDDENWIIKSKIRTGGYLNQGNIEKYKLHHFLMNVPGDSTKHYIHHRGHTFDNRKEFLSSIQMSKHNEIHETEPTQDIYRSKCIMIGDFYDTVPDCNCSLYKTKTTVTELECNDYCPGTLLIEDINNLSKFINIIKSSQYEKLPK